jgi:hypothetical protein
MDRSTRALAAMLVAAALPTPARASQDELPATLPAPDRWIEGEPDEGAVLFPAVHGQIDLGVYPTYPDVSEFHFWHGRVGADLGFVRKNDRWAVHASMTMQLVADPRNTISFRPTQMYYEVAGAFEHRVGPGVLALGYHHRCTHGTDGAVPTRIIIRSGPEVAYASERDLGRVTLTGRGFAMLLVAGQYADGFKPRGLAGGTVQAAVTRGQVRGVLAVGLGVAPVGDQGEPSYYVGTPLGEVHAELLPSAAVAIELHGDAFDGRLLAHGQRLLDSGIGREPDPTWLVSVGPGFWW